MRGLAAIPGHEELAHAYAELQSAQASRSPEQIVKWSQWSRFDPRLAEQLVSHLVQYWTDLSIRRLRERLEAVPWPGAFGVLLSHGKFHPDLPRHDRRAYSAWVQAVMSGLPRGDGGMFFVGTRSFAGSLARQDAEQSSKPYREWGYLGRDLLINKSLRVQRTTHSPEMRRRVLDALIESHAQDERPLTTREYRDALGGGVSPRQAELDLRAHPRLRARGRTKARVFVVLAARGRRHAARG